MLSREGQKGLADTGGRFQSVSQEQLQSLEGGCRAYQLRVLQRSAQKQVVGAVASHSDAHAGLVEILDSAECGARGDDVRAFDDHVRGGKEDLRRSCGIDGKEGNVPALNGIE